MLGLGVGDQLVVLGLGVGDQLVALGLALGDVLVVQALGELDDAGRGGGTTGGGSRGDRSGNLFDDGLGLGRGLDDGDRSGGGRGARLELGDARLELLVLGDRLAPLDDDLVEEVIDLVRVEALLEADVLELLGDDVFGGQSHGVSSFGAHDANRSGRTAIRGAVLEQHSPHT